ncbi:hypothetical protein AB182_06540 [Phytobacter ursingii]|uniref:Uncharacterized protein n=1 Tax=Phytobacter ursingii TaxID=1972431 RepID=A0AAC8TL53_9ENTR|nr:hypothetical protein AB182_06540 [Phytobacter ursingii]
MTDFSAVKMKINDRMIFSLRKYLPPPASTDKLAGKVAIDIPDPAAVSILVSDLQARPCSPAMRFKESYPRQK